MRTADSLNMQQALNQAAHLFGHKPNPEPQPVLPEVLQPEGVTMAVHPMILKSDFAFTMDSFRLHIADYNKNVKEENKHIDKHNALVIAHLAEHELTEAERKFIALFHQHYFTKSKKDERKKRNLTSKEFNDKVDEFCKSRGYLIAKEKIQTVKPGTELYFQHFLYAYSEQMNARTSRYIQYGTTAPRPLQELEIQSNKITSMKRNGVQSLPACNKTVRNHRQRLEEAGVLIDYVFCGSYAGVRCKINPSILSFTDVFTPKEAVTENQSLRKNERKVLPDSSKVSSTSTVNNQCKIKDNASQSSFDKESPQATSSFHYREQLYKNTLSNANEISPGGAPREVLNKPKTLSERLRDSIIHPQELAVLLAKGEFNNYVPIDVRLLWQEASRGTLTEAEFHELWMQDFFKTAAKLWRDSTPYAGSWKKAINEWMECAMIAYPAKKVFDKMTIASHIEEYRWCIENARKWFNKTGIKPLFPSDYFDRNRRKKHEVGFMYQKERYKRYLKGKETADVRKRKSERAAELRKIKYNSPASRFKRQLDRFLNGKTTLPKLESYVQKHLPSEFYEALPAIIRQKTAAGGGTQLQIVIPNTQYIC